MWGTGLNTLGKKVRKVSIFVPAPAEEASPEEKASRIQAYLDLLNYYDTKIVFSVR